MVRGALSSRPDKTLYIKADARTPCASLIKVLDAVLGTGAERITLLTAQRDSDARALPVAPKGLELQIVRPHP
jgi:hypothetical protein